MSRTLKLTRPLISFDLETTGLSIQEDRIVEISAVKLMPDGTRDIRTKRINPAPREISPQASAIHGIYAADIAESPTFFQVAKAMSQFFTGCDLTGFNLKHFDIPILTREFKDAGYPFPEAGIHVVDSYRIFTKKEPRTLSAALKFYCDKELTDAHSAEADAIAAADILQAQIMRYTDLPNEIESLEEVFAPDKKNWFDDDGKLLNTPNGVAIGFGKHKGRTLTELARDERGYLEWIARSNFTDKVKSAIESALTN